MVLYSWMVLFRDSTNPERLSIEKTTLTIFVFALILMSPYFMWNQEDYVYFVITFSWQFLVQAVIPCNLLLFLNIALYKKLQSFKASGGWSDKTKVLLRKSMIRIRLSLSISSIFVLCESLMWLPYPAEVSRNTISWIQYSSLKL